MADNFFSKQRGLQYLCQRADRAQHFPRGFCVRVATLDQELRNVCAIGSLDDQSFQTVLARFAEVSFSAALAMLGVADGIKRVGANSDGVVLLVRRVFYLLRDV